MFKLFKKEPSEEMKQLFAVQMDCLRNLGVRSAIVDALAAQRDQVLEKTISNKVPEGMAPFVPVIPQLLLSLPELMKLVRHSHRTGELRKIKDSEYADQIATPEDPYFLFQVEDGYATTDMRSETACEDLQKKSRLCLTVAEAVAVCIHIKTLTDHGVITAGTRKKDDQNQTLGICLDNAIPALFAFPMNLRDKSWGTPSCAERSHFSAAKK